MNNFINAFLRVSHRCYVANMTVGMTVCMTVGILALLTNDTLAQTSWGSANQRAKDASVPFNELPSVKSWNNKYPRVRTRRSTNFSLEVYENQLQSHVNALLSESCSKGQFNQKYPGSYAVPILDNNKNFSKTLGYAHSNGLNLRDANGLANPDTSQYYLFLQDGTTSCTVYSFFIE